MNFYSQRLAARARARQVELVLQSEAVALHVDRQFAKLWRAILSGLREPTIGLSIHRYLNLFNQILPTAINAAHEGLSGLAWWIFRHHRNDLGGTLPVRYLQLATVQTYLESELREDKDREPRTQTKGSGRKPPRRPGAPPQAPDRWPRRVQPGAVQIAKALGLPPITLTDPFREPVKPDMPKEEKRQLLLDVLFPPPTKEKVDSIVFGTTDGLTWLDRLTGATRTSATPYQLATTVAAGVAAGKTAQEIARDLLPIVDGVRSTARRIARTESFRVGTEIALENANKLGDLLVGHMLHATLDHRTRSWHAARDGQIYYVSPKEGQKGLRQMPRPPLEPEDPAERPPGTPRVAQNCRCVTSEVLSTDDELLNDPHRIAVFRNNADKLIPDPVSYSDWFQQAGQERQRLAVGAKRFNTVSSLINDDSPPWSAFIDPSTGDLLGLDVLRSESPQERSERINRVQALVDQRREQIRQVRQYGFLLPV